MVHCEYCPKVYHIHCVSLYKNSVAFSGLYAFTTLFFQMCDIMSTASLIKTMSPALLLPVLCWYKTSLFLYYMPKFILSVRLVSMHSFLKINRFVWTLFWFRAHIENNFLKIFDDQIAIFKFDSILITCSECRLRRNKQYLSLQPPPSPQNLITNGLGLYSEVPTSRNPQPNTSPVESPLSSPTTTTPTTTREFPHGSNTTNYSSDESNEDSIIIKRCRRPCLSSGRKHRRKVTVRTVWVVTFLFFLLPLTVYLIVFLFSVGTAASTRWKIAWNCQKTRSEQKNSTKRLGGSDWRQVRIQSTEYRVQCTIDRF